MWYKLWSFIFGRKNLLSSDNKFDKTFLNSISKERKRARKEKDRLEKVAIKEKRKGERLRNKIIHGPYFEKALKVASKFLVYHNNYGEIRITAEDVGLNNTNWTNRYEAFSIFKVEFTKLCQAKGIGCFNGNDMIIDTKSLRAYQAKCERQPVEVTSTSPYR